MPSLCAKCSYLPFERPLRQCRLHSFPTLRFSSVRSLFFPGELFFFEVPVYLPSSLDGPALLPQTNRRASKTSFSGCKNADLIWFWITFGHCFSWATVSSGAISFPSIRFARASPPLCLSCRSFLQAGLSLSLIVLPSVLLQLIFGFQPLES